MSPRKTRGFAVTIFDYAEKIDFINSFFENNLEWGCYGEEVTKSGTKHLQGFMQFKNPRTASGVIKYFEKTCLKGIHIEYAKGTPGQNKTYCMKELIDFNEFGTIPTPGKRNDLSEVRNKIIETGRMRDIIDMTENMQQIRGSEKYLTYKEPSRNWECNVFWFYGETGTNKSRTAHRMANPDDKWICGDTLKWWDGYDGHEDIILDDFRGDYCKFAYLLKILDRYPLQVEVKGGFRQLRARNIFITSDVHPTDVYSDTVGRKDQLLRRISIIRRFSKKGTEVMEQRSGVILCPDLKYEIMNFKWN